MDNLFIVGFSCGRILYINVDWLRRPIDDHKKTCSPPNEYSPNNKPINLAEPSGQMANQNYAFLAETPW